MKQPIKKHSRRKCPYLHVKNCEGCGKSCWCYTKTRDFPRENAPESQEVWIHLTIDRLLVKPRKRGSRK